MKNQMNNSTNNVNVLGKLDLKGWHDILCRIYDNNGISPTINTCGGGGTEPKIIVRYEGNEEDKHG